MSEPRMDAALRIGPYLYVDILRALGFPHWFLTNVADEKHPAEPVLASIMACLVEAQLAQPHSHNGHFSYDRDVEIWKTRFQPRMEIADAHRLLNETCDRAARLNLDPECPYFYQQVYLFGSCLTEPVTVGDVDLGIVVDHRDGGRVPEPDYNPPPLRIDTDFTRAGRLLTNRRPKLISIHDLREVERIGAPHRLIWDARRGRIHDALFLRPKGDSVTVADLQVKQQRYAEIQERFRAVEKRVYTITRWPEPRQPDVSSFRSISRKTWVQLFRDSLVVHLAHAACLFEGEARQQCQRAIEFQHAKVTKAVFLRASEAVGPFLKASLAYGSWRLRKNGRLLRCAT